jgi:hypothetical protein
VRIKERERARKIKWEEKNTGERSCHPGKQADSGICDKESGGGTLKVQCSSLNWFDLVWREPVFIRGLLH